MKLKKPWLTAIGLIMLSSRAWGGIGIAHVQGTTEDSDVTGELRFEDSPDGLKITGLIDNVIPGEHAFHIHEFGDCSDEGKNAGSHFNPDGHPHGDTMKQGVHKVHVGDMGNILFNDDGTARINVVLKGVALTGGKLNVAGRSVVLHEKKDDFSQPTGNAGGRIGCAPILLSGK